MGRIGFAQPLSTNGDGTGTIDMSVDHSTVQGVYKLTAGDTDLYVTRLIIYYEDTGTLSPTTMGAATALTTGILADWRDSAGTKIADLYHPSLAIKQNGDWARIAYDAQPQAGFGAGAGAYQARWTFSKFYGGDLHMRPGDELRFILDDDLSVLDRFFIVAEGWYSGDLTP